MPHVIKSILNLTGLWVFFFFLLSPGSGLLISDSLAPSICFDLNGWQCHACLRTLLKQEPILCISWANTAINLGKK